MIADIYIRTYHKDFEILCYCLKSIKKYLTGYRNIIINVRNKEYNLLLKTLNPLKDEINFTIVQSHDFPNNLDYCGQQICKLEADLYTDAEYILYIDSDCIFYGDTDVNDYFNKETGNLYLLYNYWKDVGEAIMWLKCLIKLDIQTEYEFMRRLPQLYPSYVLKNIRELIINKTNKNFMNGCLDIYKNYNFSEFNIIGTYLYLNDKNIDFVFYDDKLHKIKCQQFWSYENKNVLISKIKQLLE